MRLILVACRMRRFPFLAASMRVFRLLSMLLLFAVAGVAYANPQAQTLWRLLDYIAVDYPAAIGEDGKVVSQLEYDEMTEFRSEEHTSELQSLMRISYAVFCLKKKKQQHTTQTTHRQHKQ